MFYEISASAAIPCAAQARINSQDYDLFEIKQIVLVIRVQNKNYDISL